VLCYSLMLAASYYTYLCRLSSVWLRARRGGRAVGGAAPSRPALSPLCGLAIYLVLLSSAASGRLSAFHSYSGRGTRNHVPRPPHVGSRSRVARSRLSVSAKRK
jgi:hypothetical protein